MPKFESGRLYLKDANVPECVLKTRQSLAQAREEHRGVLSNSPPAPSSHCLYPPDPAKEPYDAYWKIKSEAKEVICEPWWTFNPVSRLFWAHEIVLLPAVKENVLHPLRSSSVGEDVFSIFHHII